MYGGMGPNAGEWLAIFIFALVGVVAVAVFVVWLIYLLLTVGVPPLFGGG